MLQCRRWNMSRWTRYGVIKAAQEIEEARTVISMEGIMKLSEVTSKGSNYEVNKSKVKK